jgi:DNA (cytosine-5)-methyltransferase 1
VTTRSVPDPRVSLDYFRDADQIGMRLALNGHCFESLVEAADAEMDAHHAWWHSYMMGNHVSFPKATRTLRIADLFCGPGGLSQGVTLGARALGMKTQHQLAVDNQEDTLRVFSANHRPRLSLQQSPADLVHYTLDETEDGVKFHKTPTIRDPRVEALTGQLDVLVAGPPCQGHSTANTKRGRFFDQRNLLYLTVPAIAVALDVPVVIIENVPGVTASEQGVVQATMKLLEANKYKVTEGPLNAADLGWAQSRKRYFMVASKVGTPLKIRTELVDAFRRPPMAIKHLLGDLLDVQGSDFMTEGPELSEANLERIRFLHEKNVYDLPDEYRNPRAQEVGTTYRSVYGRMYWDKPSQTITTGFMTPGRGRYVHPLRQRTLLPREAARLQGFPDTYVFDAFGEEPARGSLAKWIGDAVPSPLGFAAAVAGLHCWVSG